MTKKFNTGLGRGLDALLSSAVEFSDQGIKFKSPDDVEITGNANFVEISKIVRNPYQPRKEFDKEALEELKKSLIEHGLITPITVRKAINGFELIAGERRLRAATEAGWKKIPAYIREADTNVKMLELALLENLQREDLNPIEMANGFASLIEDFNITQEEVAKRLSKDRATIANYLRLLKLPESIQDSLRMKQGTMGHAKAVLGLNDRKKMIKAWEIINKKQLSVRQTEDFVRNIELGLIDLGEKFLKSPVTKPKEKSNISSDILALIEENEKKLRYRYGVKIRINAKDDVQGTIEFTYSTIDDFGRVMDILLQNKEDN